MSLKTTPYKGTRDFYPDDKRLHDWVFDKLTTCIKKFGFEPYDGPLIESFDLYAAKTGEEIVSKQLYHFLDRSDRKIAIRPEMTPTLARMVAAKFNELPKPIRWYSTPNLWRYERPQRGRLREHWQLNVDILGGDQQLADLEIILAAFELINQFKGQKNIKIRVNNRLLINHFFDNELGLSKEISLRVSKLIDAKDKLPAEAYKEALDKLELSEDQLTQLDDFFTSDLKTISEKYPCEGSKQLTQLFAHTGNHPVKEVLFFDPYIMRGLDYYTGLVFEIFDNDPKNNRAMFGGGRYDNLIGLFGNKELSGVGFGMGDVTLKNFLESHSLIEMPNSKLDFLICLQRDEDIALAQNLITQLRNEGYSAATPLEVGSLKSQLKYANKVNAKSAIFIGEEELKSNQIVLKVLETGDQKNINIDSLISEVAPIVSK